MLLLDTVREDENQERHAIRKVFAETEPLGKLGAELGPPRVVLDDL